jgi:hypothetical protein
MLPIIADAGLPMISLMFPAAFYLLIPIIVLEFLVGRGLPLPASRRLVGVTIANALSTVVGWPLTWIACAALQLFVIPGADRGYGFSTIWQKIASVTLQAPWLLPYHRDLYWMVPTAAMVLMVPAFFVSVFVERLVLRLCWGEMPGSERRRFAWLANATSYLFLLATLVMLLLYSIHWHEQHPRPNQVMQPTAPRRHTFDVYLS